MSGNDYGIAACVRMADLVFPYPGSRVYYCVLCRSEVWASPATQRLIAQGLPTVCMRCLPQVTQEAKDAGEGTIMLSAADGPEHVRNFDIKPWPFKRGTDND